jgi:hypothetical protein
MQFLALNLVPGAFRLFKNALYILYLQVETLLWPSNLTPPRPHISRSQSHVPFFPWFPSCSATLCTNSPNIKHVHFVFYCNILTKIKCKYKSFHGKKVSAKSGSRVPWIFFPHKTIYNGAPKKSERTTCYGRSASNPSNLKIAHHLRFCGLVLISRACCIKCTNVEVGRNIFVGGENGQSAKNARRDRITLSRTGISWKLSGFDHVFDFDIMI